jgi:hypothetical protein
VAGIARDSGVTHLVCSFVGGAERGTGIDHFESKAEIEQHILALGVPATILRPAFFMSNLLPTPTPWASGSWRCPSSGTSRAEEGIPGRYRGPAPAASGSADVRAVPHPAN